MRRLYTEEPAESSNVEGNILHFDGVDVLDGAPLLDIKPYIARFDRIEGTCNGWHDEVDEETARLRGKRE